MLEDTIKARLNLNAVVRNLEVLPTLDADAASLIKSWTVSVRFSVFRSLCARLHFYNGTCLFQPESPQSADVSLFFLSPAHLNSMFEGRSNPIPLKGFSRLGFLKNEFSRLTERLEHFLKPTDALLADPRYLEVNTTLTLYTAVFALCEIARLDPVARLVAAQMPAGTLQFSVLPEGPHAHVIYDGRGGVQAGRGPASNPSACISFKDREIANAMFSGKMDGFAAVALGDVRLRGIVPMIDNTNLMLDRIPLYLQ